MREGSLLGEETLPSLVSYPRNHTCHNGEKKTKGKMGEAVARVARKVNETVESGSDTLGE